MQLKRLEKKIHFFFGKKVLKAKLIFRKRYSNFFFTLLDLKGKVVCCKTSGCHRFCSSKKKKTSFQAVECIVNLFIPIFNIYGLKELMIEFKDLPSGLCYTLANYLEVKGISVTNFKMLPDSPHNGVRGRKLRRV